MAVFHSGVARRGTSRQPIVDEEGPAMRRITRRVPGPQYRARSRRLRGWVQRPVRKPSTPGTRRRDQSNPRRADDRHNAKAHRQAAPAEPAGHSSGDEVDGRNRDEEAEGVRTAPGRMVSEDWHAPQPQRVSNNRAYPHTPDGCSTGQGSP